MLKVFPSFVFQAPPAEFERQAVQNLLNELFSSKCQTLALSQRAPPTAPGM